MNQSGGSLPVPGTSLVGQRIVIPGGTGAVGEGIVRAYLLAGAHVVVPTRTQGRADEFSALIGQELGAKLTMLVHRYETFEQAEELATTIRNEFGEIHHVVASIGGWWAGKALWEISESDWNQVFVTLTTTHLAIARAFLPALSPAGSYTLILGGSAQTPVPGSGMVSMEQAALLMMRGVLSAELGHQLRVNSLVLGPVRNRLRRNSDPSWIHADSVGAVAVAISTNSSVSAQDLILRTDTAAESFVQSIGA